MNKTSSYIIIALTTLGLWSCGNKNPSSIKKQQTSVIKTSDLTKVLQGEMLPMEYCLRTVSRIKGDTVILEVLDSWRPNNGEIDHCISETWRMLELKKDR